MELRFVMICAAREGGYVAWAHMLGLLYVRRGFVAASGKDGQVEWPGWLRLLCVPMCLLHKFCRLACCILDGRC